MPKNGDKNYVGSSYFGAQADFQQHSERSFDNLHLLICVFQGLSWEHFIFEYDLPHFNEYMSWMVRDFFLNQKISKARRYYGSVVKFH